MKFSPPEQTKCGNIDKVLRLGNVYPCKGSGKTRYWVVVGLNDRTVNLLGIDKEGIVTSTMNCGAHVFSGVATPYFRTRTLLGHCAGVKDMVFDVEWYGGE